MDPVSQYRSQESASLAISRFMSRVYGWMTFGLLITAGMGFVISSDKALMATLFRSQGLMLLLFLVQLGVVIGLSAGIQRMSVGAATFCFLLYSFLTGITFSTIFLVYSLDSIGQVFAITAGSFAGLAIFGYVTKRDLSGVGSFMIMGLWGIIIAAVVNFFLRSSALDFTLSIASVFIFAGLTAYDVQKLKSFATMGDVDSDMGHKGAIMGALTLYLDFINLFLALLRLLGGRDRD